MYALCDESAGCRGSLRGEGSWSCLDLRYLLEQAHEFSSTRCAAGELSPTGSSPCHIQQAPETTRSRGVPSGTFARSDNIRTRCVAAHRSTKITHRNG